MSGTLERWYAKWRRRHAPARLRADKEAMCAIRHLLRTGEISDEEVCRTIRACPAHYSGMGLLMGVDTAPASGSEESVYSLNPDGSTGYVSIGSGVVAASATITVVGWANYAGGAGAYQTLFGGGTTAGNWSIFLGMNSSGKAEAQITTANSAGITATGTTSPSVGTDTWYHQALVWTPGTSLKIYTNGTLEKTTTTADASGLRTPFSGLNFGTFPGQSLWLNGFMDDIAIFNSDLGATTIANLASGAVFPGTLSPSGFWNFEEGTGTTTADQSGNGNNGTLHGTVTWSTDVPSQLT